MASNAVGTKIKMIVSEVPVVIANLTEISGLELSADTIDVTSLDSTGGYREFIGGFKDAGEVNVSGYFDPSAGKGQAELLTAFESGLVNSFVIEFPTVIGKKWDFDGVVTGFSTSVSLEDPLSFEATIKVSGAPSLVALT